MYKLTEETIAGSLSGGVSPKKQTKVEIIRSARHNLDDALHDVRLLVNDLIGEGEIVTETGDKLLGGDSLSSVIVENCNEINTASKELQNIAKVLREELL